MEKGLSVDAVLKTNSLVTITSSWPILMAMA